MDDRCTGILAERQYALGCCLGIAQKRQSHIAVVIRSLRIAEDGSYLLVVFATQAELHVVEGLLGQQGQSLGCDLQNLFALKS